MASKLTRCAICYDFDGTLSPGYMQNYEFIPRLGVKPAEFWKDVKKLARDQNGDEILIYMSKMLRDAEHAGVSVKKEAFEKFGEGIDLFDGLDDWFSRVNAYGKSRDLVIEHYIISSGLREMIRGTPISKHFTEIYASGFWYDHEGVARHPAIGINYTTKTQFLFRINKGAPDVWDKEKVNRYVPQEERPIPFTNMIFIGDGDTDIPCFRLVKDQGGNSIAVYRPRAKKGGKSTAEKLHKEGRVNFFAPANYASGSEMEKIIFAILDGVAADTNLRKLGRKV